MIMNSLRIAIELLWVWYTHIIMSSYAKDSLVLSFKQKNNGVPPEHPIIFIAEH
jgi:hypothetical protein